MRARRLLPLLLPALLLCACARGGAEPVPAVPEAPTPVAQVQNTQSQEDTAMLQRSAELAFDSFDGGGPAYTALAEDPDLISIEERHVYGDPDHGEMTGSGYSVVFTLTGRKPGETLLRITGSSPIVPEEEYVYRVTVDEDLNVALTPAEEDRPGEPRPMLAIRAGERVFYAVPEDNSSARALVEALSAGSIEIGMQDYGGFEKVGPLPWTLPRNDEEITTEPGDVILYQGDKITLYYDVNTWSFTRLARIGGATREDLLAALGDGDVTVSLWVEWSE